MACKFKIPFSGNAQHVLNKARTAVEGQGGTFNGHESSGEFEVSVMGTIKGSYLVMGNELDITIDSKPMFVSCGMIESFLKNKIGG
ncbi:MAG: hypothetical protein M3004_09815 [Bacteroidota bacterium]|nr:hypothetical protein [Bacteroidota bacterium]